jgi:hypothetical protein
MDLLLYLWLLGVPDADEEPSSDEAENDDVPRDEPDEAVPSPPGRGKG